MAPTEGPDMAQLAVEQPQGVEEEVFVPTGELARIAKEELGEDHQTREYCLHELRTWLESRPHLANCRTDRRFLLRFLRSQKFDLAKTKKVLVRYLRMRVESPEWFMNLDPTTENFQELVNGCFIFVLPERDAHGRRVIVNMGTRFDLDRHNNSDIMKVMVATAETLLEDEENQIRGFTSVIFCRGMSLAHCSVWTPSEAARLFSVCEKNFAMRHKDISIIGLPFCFWAVLEFLKRFLSPKIKSRLDAGCDESKLVKKVCLEGSEKLLPPELGGCGPTAAEMAAQWLEVLKSSKSALLAMDLMTVSGNLCEEETTMTSTPTTPDLKKSPFKKSASSASLFRSSSSSSMKKSESSRSLWSYIPGMS